MMPYIKTLQKSETQSTASRTALKVILFRQDKKKKRNPLSSYKHVGFAVLHVLVLCRIVVLGFGILRERPFAICWCFSFLRWGDKRPATSSFFDIDAEK